MGKLALPLALALTLLGLSGGHSAVLSAAPNLPAPAAPCLSAPAAPANAAGCWNYQGGVCISCPIQRENWCYPQEHGPYSSCTDFANPCQNTFCKNVQITTGPGCP